jgi:hypothetical protein
MLPVALLALALALTACGGGGSSSSGSGSSESTSTASTESGSTASGEGSSASDSGDEAAIAATIEKASTSADPSKCTELQTTKFNEEGGRLNATQGQIACEKVAAEGSPPANGAKVVNIDVEGETAQAEATLEGASMNGQTLEIELVKEGGKWKMNQFLGFNDYEPKAVAEGVEERLKESGAPAKIVKCMGAGYAKFSQEQSEEISIEGNLEPVEELLRTCE